MTDYSEIASAHWMFLNSIAWLEWAKVMTDLLKGISWPAALVICVILFREKLKELLPLIRVKYKDTEMSFQIKVAEADAVSLPASIPSITAPLDPQAVAESSPEELILSIWTDLVPDIRKAARPYLINHKEFKNITTLSAMRMLRDLGALSPEAFTTYNDLRKIRNNIAKHGSDGSLKLQDAMTFADLVGRLRAALDEMPSLQELDASAGVGPFATDD